MNNEKVKARVSIGGASVEVEARADELEEVIRRVVSALSGVQGSRGGGVERGKRGVSTCRDALERLIDEGFFDVPRVLSEVSTELSRRGYFYDSTAVAHSLLDLVREERLKRDGAPRRYTYISTAPRKQAKGEEGELSEEEVVFKVKCPNCGWEQETQGKSVKCDSCGSNYEIKVIR